MDADLQHDATLLPRMLARLKAEELDLVIGSRYAAGGSTGEWSRRRLFLSRLGIRGAQWLLQRGELRDPLSGFFLLRREVLEGCVRRLSQQGFKLLLDILASAPQPLRFAEMPYRFAPREHGVSKLGAAVTWQFGLLLLDKLAGHFLPERFLLYAAVGASGVLVQLAALAALRHALPFAAAQACAVWLAMTSNYLLNNAITWRDRRLRGWRFWRGLAAFYVICSIGAVANVGVGTLLRWHLVARRPRQCDRGSGVELRREPLLHLEWRAPVRKRHGLRAGGAHPVGVRAVDCRPWHSARPCTTARHNIEMHHTPPRPSGKRQAGSGG